MTDMLVWIPIYLFVCVTIMWLLIRRVPGQEQGSHLIIAYVLSPLLPIMVVLHLIGRVRKKLNDKR